MRQFLRLYRSFSTEQKDQLLFGDECEYMLIEFNDEGDASLCLDGYEVLERLHALKDCVGIWSPEYARFMLEASPYRPYNSLAAVICFERNMRLRRLSVAQCLGPRSHLVSLAVYPRLGCPPHPPCRSPVRLVVPTLEGVDPAAREPQDFRLPAVQGEARSFAESNLASRSFFESDELIYPHPRFGSLAWPFLLTPKFLAGPSPTTFGADGGERSLEFSRPAYDVDGRWIFVLGAYRRSIIY